MNKTIKILILDDNVSDAELMKRRLRKDGLDFISLAVQDEQAYIDALKEFSPHIILSDYSLPHFDGLAALNLARKIFPDIPFIIVSGAIGEEFAVEILKAGATDYVLKDRLSRLKPAITRAWEESKTLREKKRAEKLLEHTAKKYSAMLERIQSGYWLLDLQGNLLEVNNAYCKMSGYTSRELLKMKITDLECSENTREVFDHIKLIRQKGSDQFESRHRRKDGSVFDVEIYSAFLDVDEERIAVLLRDITARKEYESSLKQLADDLKRSNKDLEQFAYIASHDLREPLRAVSGFVGLLSQKYKDKLDRQAMEYIDFASKSVIRMDELLSGLLEYSRVHTGSRIVTIVSAQDALNAAIANLHRSIGESKAVITSDKLPDVRFDEKQLTHIFQNLLHNAIKFKSERDLQVHIGCEQQNDGWLFSVKDNGIGIEKPSYDRIFKIFQRIQPLDKYPGHGIGLSICKKIIERHSGKIWVESVPGVGSTFFFTIPHLA
ncbi:MAG: hypothetical protein A2Y10_06625 [Planctomycetes bacterium GWF2_41_51]|nr:MAG: hypothetical protein A2Y10_06625 [Planctomycetes bacterium GWF2_41_51]HBG28141.1 PAS domain-containing sensor histidine kinase [Phycisphaerales bacterium]